MYYESDLIRIAQICLKLLQEVCLGPRTNYLINFRNDSDYDPDPDYDN